MKKILIAFSLALQILLINQLRAEETSALLLACNNLNQPDLKELTVIRKSPTEDILYLYLYDSNGRLNIQRHLQREEDGWYVYIYYRNKVLTRRADCMEMVSDL
ncbi:MAG: hypothetical protein L6Q33_13915 [Bacteriovoracaceae bacterium]|nr:hypothetical protein [Bacteriovoracaceae bacterium]